MLEHMVDAALYLEGENRYDHRILRSIEIDSALLLKWESFQWGKEWLVKNPSEMFLEERSLNIRALVFIHPLKVLDQY